MTELSLHDWFDIALGVLSLLGTLVGLIVAASAVTFAADANKLSSKVVEMNLFSHKREVAPALVLSWSPAELGETVVFQLTNKAIGKAIIYTVQTSFLGKRFERYFPVGNKAYPLLHNGFSAYELITGLAPQEQNDESYLRAALESTLVNSWVVAFYKDHIGTPYRVLFSFKAMGNKYADSIQELDPDNNEYKQYFLKD